MQEIKDIGQKLQKSYVRKAGTIAKEEFGNFQTMLFRENSEELEPQIRQNWSRPPSSRFYGFASMLLYALEVA